MKNNSFPVIKEAIKLVIWDLDDTFWRGTLNEGQIQWIDNHTNLLLELTSRGIINSICSKNDYDPIKELLVERKLWDYFVFPSIGWIPKGSAIKRIISQTRLREENVLFIEDNIVNREEALFYNPFINVMLPEETSGILTHPSFRGKDDNTHTQLHYYKILENQSKHQTNDISNEDFLLQSNIRVTVHMNCMDFLERIYEMIHRTNQLNYTKSRISHDQLCSLLADPLVKTGCISVSDRYGDYDIVGFFAVQDMVLIHFLFSCRILNLGVEQWLYSKLNFPQICISGKVAVELVHGYTPRWIQSEYCFQPDIPVKSPTTTIIQCIVRGGCDLEQLSHYLTYKNIQLKRELCYYTHEKGEIRRDHMEIVKNMVCLTEEERRYLLDTIPFYESHMYETGMFDESNNVLIYSMLNDYSAGIYRFEHNPRLQVIYGCYELPITSSDKAHLLPEWSNEQIKRDACFLNWFTKETSFTGPIEELVFESNLRWLREHLPKETLLILLNGGEIEFQDSIEKNRHLHHRQMNTVLKQVVNSFKKTYIIDVNQYITSHEDYTDSISHYKRHVYKSLASEIVAIVEKEFSIRPEVDKKMQRNTTIKDLLAPDIWFEEERR